jgi:hypothetical protein
MFWTGTEAMPDDLQAKVERKRALASVPAASGRFAEPVEDDLEEEAGRSDAIGQIAKSRGVSVHRNHRRSW